jgi:dethiobiotin synthetase
MKRSGLFITGTDTGVGKTVVTCALLHSLRGLGIDVAPLKAVETGVGDAGPLDAIALRNAAGVDEPLDLICPQQFELPAAPNVAADHEGKKVDVTAIRRAFDELSSRYTAVLVEGAGGLMVPLTAGFDMASLAAELTVPVIVVARGSLGTINHTLLTLAELDRRGLELAGVVISHAAGALSDADALNLEELRQMLGLRLIGEIPPLSEGERPRGDAIDLERVLGG